MMKKTVAGLAFGIGALLSGLAFAEPAKFDGTWSVSLVANAACAAAGPVQP